MNLGFAGFLLFCFLLCGFLLARFLASASLCFKRRAAVFAAILALSLERTSRFVQRDRAGLQYRKRLRYGASKTACFVVHFVDDCDRGIFFLRPMFV
jgi:hypothetical protein